MATEQRTTIEQRRALRARYAPEPVPRCICGKPMGTYGIPDGLVRDWLCDDGHADAYAVTTARIVPLAGDPDVLAACDDAESLAGARAAIIPALDQIGTCAGWLAESGSGDEQTSIARLGIDQAVKAIRAALTPGKEGAIDGNG